MTASHGTPLAETLDDGAWPQLSDEQIAKLAPQGERRPFVAGETLFSAGDLVTDLPVILTGSVEVVDGDRALACAGPRRFLGEIGLLNGQASFVTARAAEPGELLAVPV